MKERPILMSAPVVRAVLSGAKTQTRRPMNPQPMMDGGCYFLDDGTGWETQERERWPCPHGTVGDRLWVRENFQPIWASNEPGDYKTGAGYRINYPATDGLKEWCDEINGEGWITSRVTPSIHMPRWASRIALEIVSVRVERVQEISHRDALTEGVEYDVSLPDGAPLPRFQKLWDSIYAKRDGGKFAWDTNCWVWVIEFKAIS